MKRKPIFQTNFIAVIVLACIFAPLGSWLTEDLTVFIYSMLSIPVLALILLGVWWKFGYSGIVVNSINAFIMITMMAGYISIPLIYALWGTWPLAFVIGVYLGTFVIGYIKREKLIMNLAGVKNTEEDRKPSKFLFYYMIGALIVGIVATIIINVVVETDGEMLVAYSLFSLLGYYIFAVSPALLVKPKRALEMGAITEQHYKRYH